VSSRRAPVKGPVSRALAPYRTRLAGDSRAFTTASLTLARATVDASTGFNQATPEMTAAFAALSTWQREVLRAQKKVESVSSKAVGQKVAVQWLKSVTASLALVNQSLSLTDPKLAADAAERAQRSFAESHRLAAELAKLIA
jgi:hypothetical protein